MESLKSTVQSHSQEPASRFLELGISPSIGPIRCTTTYEAGKRPRTTFQSDRDKELARAREIYCQKKLVEHDKRREQSASNPGHSTALNIKECVLEVQTLFLKQLAAAKNHVKEVGKILGAPTIDLEEKRKR